MCRLEKVIGSGDCKERCLAEPRDQTTDTRQSS